MDCIRKNIDAFCLLTQYGISDIKKLHDTSSDGMQPKVTNIITNTPFITFDGIVRVFWSNVTIG